MFRAQLLAKQYNDVRTTAIAGSFADLYSKQWREFFTCREGGMVDPFSLDTDAADQETKETLKMCYQYTKFQRCCWLTLLHYSNPGNEWPTEGPRLEGLRHLAQWSIQQIDDRLADLESSAEGCRGRWKGFSYCLPTAKRIFGRSWEQKLNPCRRIVICYLRKCDVSYGFKMLL